MTKYQRRHYNDVANILRKNKPIYDMSRSEYIARLDTWADIVDNFVELFGNDNSNFDSDRFISASGNSN